MRLVPLALVIALAACGGSSTPSEGAQDTAASGPVATAVAAATPASAPSISASSEASPPATAAPSATAVAAEPPPLPKGLKVLLIGDSFAEALGAGLRAKESERGIKAILKGEKATFIPEWAGPNRGVPGLLASYKPDVVVIALGGNELAMTTPEIRAPKVKKLAELMGDTPCVWVSPPLWGIKDNGLLDIIRKQSSPCRYYDSNVLSPDLPRGSDKIHPTAEGQKKWADEFLGWLRKEQAVTAGAEPGPFKLKPRPDSE